MNEFRDSSIQQRALVVLRESLKRLQVARKRCNFVHQLSEGLQKDHLRQVDFLNASIRRFLDYCRRAAASYRRELLVQADQAREIDVYIRLMCCLLAGFRKSSFNVIQPAELLIRQLWDFALDSFYPIILDQLALSPNLIVRHDALFFHANHQAFFDSASLTLSTVVSVDFALSFVRAAELLLRFHGSSKEAFASFASKRVEMISTCDVGANLARF